jgi:glycosyltransferase involved in cell wall biosynthesis
MMADTSWSIIEQFASEILMLGVRFMRNFGKSQALHAGFATQGDVIITMDADTR